MLLKNQVKNPALPAKSKLYIFNCLWTSFDWMISIMLFNPI